MDTCTTHQDPTLFSPLGIAINTDNTLLYITDYNPNTTPTTTVTVCPLTTDGLSIDACSTSGNGFDISYGIALFE